MNTKQIANEMRSATLEFRASWVMRKPGDAEIRRQIRSRFFDCACQCREAWWEAQSKNKNGTWCLLLFEMDRADAAERDAIQYYYAGTEYGKKLKQARGVR